MLAELPAITFLLYLPSKHTHGAFHRVQEEANSAPLLCCSGLHSAASVCQKYIADTAAVTSPRHVLQRVPTQAVGVCPSSCLSAPRGAAAARTVGRGAGGQRGRAPIVGVIARCGSAPQNTPHPEVQKSTSSE